MWRYEVIRSRPRSAFFVPIWGALALAGCAGEAPPDDVDAWGVPAEDLGWQGPAGRAPAPAGVSTLRLVTALMSGAPARLVVDRAPPGSEVVLLASNVGVGQGPCHPRDPALCTELLAPRIVLRGTADGSGKAVLDLTVPLGLEGPVGFQAYVADANELTGTVGDRVAGFDSGWAWDRMGVEIRFGESGYHLGMAETGSPQGWYAEDCLLGQYGLDLCHPLAGDGVLLRSVHQNVGGGGIPDVVPGVTTLFYEIHDLAITYALFGDDSGDCWTWGHDPTYYTAVGCLPVAR